jgi:hypothetical protein
MPAPIYNLTAGNWYITIPTSTIQIIDYYIKAVNEMGNTVVSEKLRADIVFNCLEDVITLNPKIGSEKGITYTTADKQPIIVYSEYLLALKTFSFNITDRFEHTGNSSICLITDYRIDYVLVEQSGFNFTTNASYFSVDSDGIFTIKKYDAVITNLQVWISVWNTKIWGDGGGSVGYLLDISILDTDPYLPSFSPVFSTTLISDVFINLSESSDTV